LFDPPFLCNLWFGFAKGTPGNIADFGSDYTVQSKEAARILPMNAVALLDSQKCRGSPSLCKTSFIRNLQ
jgi:hypothetical protein